MPHLHAIPSSKTEDNDHHQNHHQNPSNRHYSDHNEDRHVHRHRREYDERRSHPPPPPSHYYQHHHRKNYYDNHYPNHENLHGLMSMTMSASMSMDEGGGSHDDTTSPSLLLSPSQPPIQEAVKGYLGSSDPTVLALTTKASSSKNVSNITIGSSSSSSGGTRIVSASSSGSSGSYNNYNNNYYHHNNNDHVTPNSAAAPAGAPSTRTIESFGSNGTDVSSSNDNNNTNTNHNDSSLSLSSPPRPNENNVDSNGNVNVGDQQMVTPSPASNKRMSTMTDPTYYSNQMEDSGESSVEASAASACADESGTTASAVHRDQDDDDGRDDDTDVNNKKNEVGSGSGSSKNHGPVLTIYGNRGNAQWTHSPVRVQRRVSHENEDEQHEQQQQQQQRSYDYYGYDNREQNWKGTTNSTTKSGRQDSVNGRDANGSHEEEEEQQHQGNSQHLLPTNLRYALSYENDTSLPSSSSTTMPHSGEGTNKRRHTEEGEGHGEENHPSHDNTKNSSADDGNGNPSTFQSPASAANDDNGDNMITHKNKKAKSSIAGSEQTQQGSAADKEGPKGGTDGIAATTADSDKDDDRNMNQPGAERTDSPDYSRSSPPVEPYQHHSPSHTQPPPRHHHQEQHAPYYSGHHYGSGRNDHRHHSRPPHDAPSHGSHDYQSESYDRMQHPAAGYQHHPHHGHTYTGQHQGTDRQRPLSSHHNYPPYHHHHPSGGGGSSDERASHPHYPPSYPGMGAQRGHHHHHRHPHHHPPHHPYQPYNHRYGAPYASGGGPPAYPGQDHNHHHHQYPYPRHHQHQQHHNSQHQPRDGKTSSPTNTNRCVRLPEPIPPKSSWTDVGKALEFSLPDFHRLVNYPDYLTKGSRQNLAVDTDKNGKFVNTAGRKNCVMCGKRRICSAASLLQSQRAQRTNKLYGEGVSGSSCDDSNDEKDDGTAHIIPRQNKGLCTACDVTVWVISSSGMEIKWCKGCKNFRPWAAFGEKGLATKCVRCRDRQREKYAAQSKAKTPRASSSPASLKKSSSPSFDVVQEYKGQGSTRNIQSLIQVASGGSDKTTV